MSVKEHYQIPRLSLSWVLLSLTAVILPHVIRMPLWLVALCALCIVGRVLIHQGRISYPGSWIKTLIVLLTVTALLLQFRRDIFSIEATVGVLLIAIALKLLEMRQKRDVLIVIYLSYFAVIGEFIYSQSIPIALYMAFCVLMITSSLISLNQTHDYQHPLRTARLSGMILLQSVPLMVALFLLLPRISPLWSMPLQSSTGVTGLSEAMSPGDIGRLIGSADVAFRVRFNTDEPPPVSQLYWRAITLDRFDGRQWSRRRGLPVQYLGVDRDQEQDWFQDIRYLGDRLEYNIIMEPTFENWVYTLEMPFVTDDRLMMRRDFQVHSIRNVGQRASYDLVSYQSNRTDSRLSQAEIGRWTALPITGNNESHDLARQMRATSGSDEAYIQSLLNHFRNESFYYTLTPALLGADPIDDFLFNSREGFCEHYASTFTFLARAAGIPARVVTGYQGGGYNPLDGTLTVRQYDAHAWAEVWLPDQGWVRVDPTAAVAPERIDLGSQMVFQSQAGFLENAGFSMLRFRDSQFLNGLRLRLEMIDYRWNRFVLNYDQNMQLALFGRLFENVTWNKVLYSIVGFIVLFVAAVAFFILRKRAGDERHPVTRIYLDYCESLAREGFPRHRGETPSDYCRRVSRCKPEWAQGMSAVTTSFMDMMFKKEEAQVSHEEISSFKRLVRKGHAIRNS